MDATLKKAAQMAARELVPATHAHILEQANKKLNSRREPFVKAISMKQEGDNTWLIVLDQSARWIDDGQTPHSMVDALLAGKGGKGKVKIAKDGSAYRVIPFGHGPGKGKTQSTPAEMDLQATIKSALKTAHNRLTGERGIPFAKIERNEDGSPRTGLLHTLNIKRDPIKTHNGPGQGHGPVGAVRQGPTGIPFLQGLRIYQKATVKPDGTSSVKRAITTFRVVSSKHKDQGRWFHPGTAPVHIFDEAHEWAQSHWETVVMPKIAQFVLDNS